MYSRLLIQLAAIFGLQSKLAMADDKSKGGGAAGDTGGAGGTDDGDGDGGGAADDRTVSYDTHQKMLKEVKALKRQLKERDDKLAGADNDRLAAEGKKDELIASLRKDLEKTTKANKDLVGNFVNSSLGNQVREIAAGMGCVDLDAIDKLVDLSEVEVDTKTFRADKGELTDMLTSLKKTKPYLFNKPAPKINTKMPAGGKTFDTAEGKKSLKEMTRDEIRGQLIEVQSRISAKGNR